MKTALFSKRFQELLTQADQIESAKVYAHTEYFKGHRIDGPTFLNWRVKARNLLAMACQKDSEHYRQFVETEKPSSYRSEHEALTELRAVFIAAKEDCEGGYLNSLRNILHAELFSSELDQARELLTNGYTTAAAVIAGVVLETTLRQLVQDNGLLPGSLNRMNADLAKAGCYNLMIQKRITALADIRNNAAHGNSDQFSKGDVSDMIAQVERFVGDHL